MNVTSVSARLVERAADHVATLRALERATVLGDYRTIVEILDGLDPVDLADSEDALRERALSSIQIAGGAPVEGPPSPNGPSPTTPRQGRILHAVAPPDDSDEHSMAWWREATWHSWTRCS